MAEIQISKKDQTMCIAAFESLLLKDDKNSEIIRKSLNGEIDKSNIRAMSWKIFLDTLPKDFTLEQWIEIITKQRSDYKQKKKKFLSTKKLSGDPLGAKTQSTNKKEAGWDTYFEDEKMKKLIELDLSRTYQDIDLFHQKATKLVLTSILFIWAKENSDLSYKQGMNDLLAVLYLALYPYYSKNTMNASKEDLLKYAINPQNHINELYYFFHDEEEFQCDLYWMFTSLMKRDMKDLYINLATNTQEQKNKLISKYTLFNSDWLDSDDKDIPTPIYIRCVLIIKEKLKAIDDALFSHLKCLKVDCYVFLQRWLKCIFIREFNYNDGFFIWDTILATQEHNDKYGMMFIDYLSVAMIIRIRDKLLSGDENDCFSTLFKYPDIDNLPELIELANKIKHALEGKMKGKAIKLSDVIQVNTPTKNTIQPQQQLISQSIEREPEASYSSSNTRQQNQGYSNLQSDDQNQPEQSSDMIGNMKNLFNNTLFSVGGYINDIQSTVTKQIQVVQTALSEERNRNQMINQHSSSSQLVINQSSDALRIIEKIHSRYQQEMSPNDKEEFAAAIEYYRKKY